MSPWFVLSLKPRAEKAASAELTRRGITHYLPLYHSRRRWSDRIKQVQLPLFPGYIFCQFGYSQRLEILNLPAVTNIIGYGKVPTPVPEEELTAIRLMLSSGRTVLPWPYLQPGQKIRIEQGPLQGLEGTLLRDSSTWRVIVSIELLHRSVSVEIDRDLITPVGRLQCPPSNAATRSSSSA
ncbi:MAG: UpxY family transcription antiterminator [Acidimicrobiia bacterium]|nr:UpxY family transcription antiterminator [Acidimicrobiia bacterium]